VKAFNWIEEQGMVLLGIFHSHPEGPQGPSATDLEEAAYEVVYIILSRAQGTWEARGYWIQDSQAYEISISISGDQ
jgi:proteasome lid subunit RPN8/RPN11